MVLDDSHLPGDEVDRVTYVVDANDLITEVGGGWTDFCLANDAPDLVPPRVVGRSLWDFIRDPDTRDLYQDLMRRVRANLRPVAYTMRCDSADRKRSLHMTVEPLPDRGVRFDSRTLKVEDRDPESYRKVLVFGVG